MTLVLDAGAFLAIERHDRDVVALIKRERLAGRPPLTHGGVVGQVWRGGCARQAGVSRLLAAVEIAPLDGDLGRRVGVLLAATGTSDVVDAGVVLLAHDDDEIATSDVADLGPLLVAAGLHADLLPV